MPASTEFLPFATGGLANVISQAAYAASAEQINGFQTGTAESNQVNKAIRQATFMAAVIANFMASTLATAINDDTNLAGAITNLEAALASFSNSSAYSLSATAGGTANAITAAPAPARAAYTDGEVIFLRIATTNTGAVTFNRNGLGAVPVTRADGSALQSGDLLAGSDAILVYHAGAGSYFLATIPNPLATRGFRNCQMLTAASGNFIVPAGVTNLYAEATGAGAPGGGSTGSAGAGGGGGGGGWAADMVPVTPGQSIAYSIGQSSAGTTGTGANAGSTSFGGVVAATGGMGGQGGGTSGSGNGGSPGFGTAGALQLTGSQGDAGITNGAFAIAGRGGDPARSSGAGGALAGPATGFGGAGAGNVNGAAGAGKQGYIFLFW